MVDITFPYSLSPGLRKAANWQQDNFSCTKHALSLRRTRPQVTQTRVRGFRKELESEASPQKNHAPRPSNSPENFLPSFLPPGPEAQLPLPHSACHLYKGSFPRSRHSQHQQTHGELRSPGSLGLGRSRGRRHLFSATPTTQGWACGLAALGAAIGRKIRPLAYRAAIGQTIWPL